MWNKLASLFKRYVCIEKPICLETDLYLSVYSSYLTEIESQSEGVVNVSYVLLIIFRVRSQVITIASYSLGIPWTLDVKNLSFINCFIAFVSLL